MCQGLLHGFTCLFRQTSFVHDPQFAIDLRPAPKGHCPFFRGFKGRQVQGFQQGCIAREYAPLAVELPVCRIQRFDCVCCIYDLPDICGKLENRGNGVPIILPALHGVWIFGRPFFGSTFQGFQRLFFVRCMIDRFQVCGKGFPVLFRDIFQGIPDLMYDTALVFCFGECGSNRLFYSGKPVCTEDQDIFYASVFQLIQY